MLFDGVYSHAVLERPGAGVFRVQEERGGTRARVEPCPAARDAAERLLTAAIEGGAVDGGEATCFTRAG